MVSMPTSITVSSPLEERLPLILAAMDEAYGSEVRMFLEHDKAWQLLVAVIMSAQCTDARVNEVTRPLFAKYDSLEKLAAADLEVLEQEIRPVGYFREKARHIKACANRLITDYGGQVPSSIEDLTSLPGVGRKTANVIRGNIYHQPSIVVDTHVKRISKRLGLTEYEDPVKVEFDLMKVLPRDYWIRYNTHVITLGRTLCTARSPKCGECYLKDWCPSRG